ncbi:hypothetical protein KP79_PYT23803 [Mizuhopecten yessoensis]|uniref:SGNH hydrolase-type esterase domain-containing protein n=1 Tax=Mizuhopecten yessoensis TaxID=6573 RepID=A0A210PER8_MIZYE|nr:hypothetical protein KP79_PYT23803 [Mizuhopecten yessoensis]
MKKEVAAARPDIIILHLGENDISPSRRPGDIADAVISLVEDFRALGSIVRVVAFLPRGNVSRVPGLTTHMFRQSRLAVNKILSRRLGKDLICMQRLHYPKDYSSDLVHLSDTGMLRYFLTLREVVLRS